ncbi:serine/threonine protein kinase [Arenimonas sp.]|uniref:serine/threonine protein kinase n=1 Tax=Arenimonas sp. TaxID=1872635 RepID=UPI0039E4CCB7
MELDDLKNAWQTLDRRLEKQNSLQLQIYRDGKLDTLRRSLRPLRWGQALQMILGACLVILSAGFWNRYSYDTAMLIVGIVMHVYGIACIIAGGIVQGGISEIDHSAPVLTIQKQLAIVRRRYVLSGMIVGLPWWFLWVLVLVMLTKAGTGINLFASAPWLAWGGIAGGLLGLLGTWWFHRWSRDPSRPKLAKFMDDSVTGSSLRKAGALLDEIAAFEND